MPSCFLWTFPSTFWRSHAEELVAELFPAGKIFFEHGSLKESLWISVEDQTSAYVTSYTTSFYYRKCNDMGIILKGLVNPGFKPKDAGSYTFMVAFANWDIEFAFPIPSVCISTEYESFLIIFGYRMDRELDAKTSEEESLNIMYTLDTELYEYAEPSWKKIEALVETTMKIAKAREVPSDYGACIHFKDSSQALYAIRKVLRMNDLVLDLAMRRSVDGLLMFVHGDPKRDAGKPSWLTEVIEDALGELKAANHDYVINTYGGFSLSYFRTNYPTFEYNISGGGQSTTVDLPKPQE